MIECAPFKPFIYNSEKVKIEKVISPPYDQIPNFLQNKLYKLSKNNIVRIVKGKEFLDDDERNNKYTRAKNYFEELIKNNILIPLKQESIFLYEQKYKIYNKNKKRIGVISLLKLQNFETGNILPHEKTRSAPTEDQYLMLKYCSAHFSPIFFLYSDKESKIKSNLLSSPKKILFQTEYDNIYHKLYQIDNKESIEYFREAMRNKKCIIADGHHRYSASIRFFEDFKQEYILSYFTELEDENLDILPFHRYIKSELFIGAILQEISEYFEIENKDFNFRDEISIYKMLKELNKINITKHTFGMYLYKKFYFLKLKNKRFLEEIMPDKNKYWRELSTSILHKCIIEKIFGEEVENISYIQDAVYIIKDINRNKSGIAFFVNNPKSDEIKNIVNIKETMPAKSTYFYPKIPSGLVIYKFDKDG